MKIQLLQKILLSIFVLSVFSLPLQADPIRGVWIPDPSHTTLMHTYQNITQGVKEMSHLGINTLFLCTYAKTDIAFKSEVYTRYSTFESSDQSYMFAPYAANYNIPLQSPTGDPVRDLLDEANHYGMKVIFWFEYGFMGTHGPTPDDHPLLSKNPGWQSASNDGKQAAYNHSDYYLNAYHPGLQEFLIQLMEESIRLYPDIAGIQGDDRTPAMPKNSGYDPYTVALYCSEHNGAEPPADFNDAEWTAWRLDILNRFARNLYGRIKAKSPDYLVCFAPNPYPWCLDNLMQDSQTWIKEGIVDLLSVQCYRFTEDAYRQTVTEAMKYAKQQSNKYILNPGIILKVGDRYLPDSVLQKQIEINKSLGTNGESFFYNEGFNNTQISTTLKKNYLKN